MNWWDQVAALNYQKVVPKDWNCLLFMLQSVSYMNSKVPMFKCVGARLGFGRITFITCHHIMRHSCISSSSFTSIVWVGLFLISGLGIIFRDLANNHMLPTEP